MKNLSALERKNSLNPAERFNSMKLPEVYMADNIEEYLSTPIKQSFYQQISNGIRSKINSKQNIVIPNLAISAYDYEYSISFRDSTGELNFVAYPYYFPKGYIENNLFDSRRFENYSIIFSNRPLSGKDELLRAVFQSEIDTLLSVVENPFPKNLKKYVSMPNHLRLVDLKKEAI